MAQHPALASLEEDTAVRLVRSGAVSIGSGVDQTAVAANQIPWNLDRIDQRTNVLDNKYDPAGDGSNVDIYILDTGVRLTHEEFGGRAHYAGFDAVDALTGSNMLGTDCDGHGTHCAGIAAGRTYGVAKNASIYNLRVLDCDGSGAVSGIVQALDLVTQRHQQGNEGRPIVISQSLGTPKSYSLNRGVEEATAAGVTCVGAAGNQASDSCEYSPASATMGIAVGATDEEDLMNFLSNWGRCTTVMSPGIDITSSWNTCDTCTATIGGTSMATPHVAGYAAILLALDPKMMPDDIKAETIRQSTKGCVEIDLPAYENDGDTPNRLLYVGNETATPTASPTEDSDIFQTPLP